MVNRSRLFERSQVCNLPIAFQWDCTVPSVSIGKGMPSYYVEIREDIIYNRLPLEEQLYTGFKAGCLESGPNITSSELVSELTYSMDTRGRRVVTIPPKEVTGKGLPKRQVVSSVVVSNQSSYVYSDKKN